MGIWVDSLSSILTVMTLYRRGNFVADLGGFLLVLFGVIFEIVSPDAGGGLFKVEKYCIEG